MLHLSRFLRAKRGTQIGPTSVIEVFGPFFTINGRKTNKHYGITFNCFVTRACHLEACFSLTSDTFLNAFRRFLARQGHPRLLRPDNRSNFFGARRSHQDSLNARVRSSKDKILKLPLYNGVSTQRQRRTSVEHGRASIHPSEHFGSSWDR